jgi:hypothetical protein
LAGPLASLLGKVSFGQGLQPPGDSPEQMLAVPTSRLLRKLRIPGDADQRSEVMAIAIPNSCRSAFRDDGDHCSDGKPITFRPTSEWRSASSESFS